MNICEDGAERSAKDKKLGNQSQVRSKVPISWVEVDLALTIAWAVLIVFVCSSYSIALIAVTRRRGL